MKTSWLFWANQKFIRIYLTQITCLLFVKAEQYTRNIDKYATDYNKVIKIGWRHFYVPK